MVSGLSAAVDELVGIDLDELCDAALAEEIVDVRRQIDRLEHRFATVLARAHHRGVPAGDCASSTPAWVQWKTGQRAGDAKLSLHAGLALEHLALTDKAWAQGEISASAARTICAGRNDAHGEVYAGIESTLVDYAAGHNLKWLDASIRYYRTCCDALDGKEPAELNGFHHSKVLHRWATSGEWDDLAGHIIDTALKAAIGTPIDGDERGPAKKRADAVVEIFQYFLDHADLP